MSWPGDIEWSKGWVNERGDHLEIVKWTKRKKTQLYLSNADTPGRMEQIGTLDRPAELIAYLSIK